MSQNINDRFVQPADWWHGQEDEQRDYGDGLGGIVFPTDADLHGYGFQLLQETGSYPYLDDIEVAGGIDFATEADAMWACERAARRWMVQMHHEEQVEHEWCTEDRRQWEYYHGEVESHGVIEDGQITAYLRDGRGIVVCENRLDEPQS